MVDQRSLKIKEIQIKQRAGDFKLEDASIEIQQGFTLEALGTKASEVEKLRLENNRLIVSFDKQRKPG